jgi:CBS-domain-containing membrane protein
MGKAKKAGRKSTAGGDARSRCLGDVATNAELRMRADTRLSTAWTLFLDRELQSMTVVDDSGRPVGTLLRRDLADAVLDDAPTVPGAMLDELGPELGRQLSPPGESLAASGRAGWSRGWRNEEPLVEDVMRASVNTLPASASLEDAAAVFEVAELSEVVVVDDRGRMLGLVAGEDLVPYLPSGPAAAGRARLRPAPRAAARR